MISSQIKKNTHHSKPLRSVLSLISQATWCKTYSTFKSKVNLETRTWLLYSNSIHSTTHHYPSLPHTWMGFGIPRRSSKELMESPMPPWMQRISPCFWMPSKVKSVQATKIWQECNKNNAQLGKQKEILKCQIIRNLQWNHFINRSNISKLVVLQLEQRWGEIQTRHSHLKFSKIDPAQLQRLAASSAWLHQQLRQVRSHISSPSRPNFLTRSQSSLSHSAEGTWLTSVTWSMPTLHNLHGNHNSRSSNDPVNPGLTQWNQWRGKKSGVQFATLSIARPHDFLGLRRSWKDTRPSRQRVRRPHHTSVQLSSVFKLSWESEKKNEKPKKTGPVSQCQETNRLLGRRNLPGRP